MKKLFIFLTVAALAACTCLSQIPDQLIYVDENCEAILPDYTPDVVVIDNCDNPTIVQVPQAGTILDSGQPVTQVEIIAQDMSDNPSNAIRFNVVLIDTISPVLSAGPGLLGYEPGEWKYLLTAYQRSIVQEIEDACVTLPDSLKYLFCDEKDWLTHNLVTWSPPLGSDKLVTSHFMDPALANMYCECDSAEMADRRIIQLIIEN